MHGEVMEKAPPTRYNLRTTTSPGGTFRPFFLVAPLSPGRHNTPVALHDIVEQTVSGLGYETVEIERSAGGLLRINIDFPWQPGTERFINVEDCERVTRQLQFALEVDEIEYSRLEVSSPGIDRLLKSERDFERFVGELVDLTLKAPMGAAAAGQVSANRKKFRGRLERADAGGWQISWSDEPAPVPGRKPASKAKPAAPVHVLGFRLDELKEARLASVVDFKGRSPRTVAGAT